MRPVMEILDTTAAGPAPVGAGQGQAVRPAAPKRIAVVTRQLACSLAQWNSRHMHFAGGVRHPSLFEQLHESGCRR